jgi:hypothetical protein
MPDNEQAAKEQIIELFRSAGGMKTIENLALALCGAPPERIALAIFGRIRACRCRKHRHRRAVATGLAVDECAVHLFTRHVCR